MLLSIQAGLADRLDYSHYRKVCKKEKKKSVERESKRFAGPKPSEPIAAMDLRKFYAGRCAASFFLADLCLFSCIQK